MPKAQTSVSETHTQVRLRNTINTQTFEPQSKWNYIIQYNNGLRNEDMSPTLIAEYRLQRHSPHYNYNAILF